MANYQAAYEYLRECIGAMADTFANMAQAAPPNLGAQAVAGFDRKVEGALRQYLAQADALKEQESAQ